MYETNIAHIEDDFSSLSNEICSICSNVFDVRPWYDRTGEKSGVHLLSKVEFSGEYGDKFPEYCDSSSYICISS